MLTVCRKPEGFEERSGGERTVRGPSLTVRLCYTLRRDRSVYNMGDYMGVFVVFDSCCLQVDVFNCM